MLDRSELPTIVETFGADLADAMTASEHRRSPQRRRRAALAALVAAAAVATAVVVLGTLSGPGSDVAAPALADPLARAARSALHEASLFPRDDQYYYVRTEGTQPAGMSIKAGGPGITVLVKVIVDRWQSALRSGLQRTRVAAVEFQSAADAAAWKRNHGTAPGATSSLTIPGAEGHYFVDIGRLGQLSRHQVLALPSNPKRLYRHLIPKKAFLAYVRRYGRDGQAQVKRLVDEYGSLSNFFDWYAFNEIAHSFEQGPMPPKLRSGLFGALALIPGVTNIGLDRDLAGRTGAAVTFTDRLSHVRTELIFDPETSALLGEREVAVRAGGGFHKGEVITNVAYLNEAVTNSIKIPHTKEVR